MAVKATALRLTAARFSTSSAPASASQTIRNYRSRKFYHKSPVCHVDVAKQPARSDAQNPIAASMAESTSPTGTSTAAQEHDAKNAAFLGEADSDDGFEADVEINPEAHRHKFDDVNASGLHGQAGEGDEPIERERQPVKAMDASQSAYLGEADSDDAHEADREVNPERYRHRIDDASNAAYLGESDSDDAHEVDREVNPETYSHKIEDPTLSGTHGESGEGDAHIERR